MLSLYLQHLPLIRAFKEFFFGSNLWFGGRQSTVTMGFTGLLIFCDVAISHN